MPPAHLERGTSTGVAPTSAGARARETPAPTCATSTTSSPSSDPMNTTSYAASLTTQTSALLVDHLARSDGQEDICFALWRPSQGRGRLTALVQEPILPLPGDRHVHGNVSFTPAYFQRALGIALEQEAGLVLLHSPPGGRSWQGMSPDDIAAEHGKAAQTLAATGLPVLGMTLATHDNAWSARIWAKTGPRTYQRQDCDRVCVVGDRLAVTYNDAARPRPALREELARTVSAW